MIAQTEVLAPKSHWQYRAIQVAAMFLIVLAAVMPFAIVFAGAFFLAALFNDSGAPVADILSIAWHLSVPVIIMAPPRGLIVFEAFLLIPLIAFFRKKYEASIVLSIILCIGAIVLFNLIS